MNLIKKTLLTLLLILTIFNISVAEELFQPEKRDQTKIDYSWPEEMEYHGKTYNLPKHRHHSGDILHDVYGNWTQTFETNKGTIRIIFKKVEDTWYDPVKNSPKDKKVREIEFKQIQDVYEIEAELRDTMRVIELKTPEKIPGFSTWADKVAFVFRDYFRFRHKTRNEGHWTGYARIACVDLTGWGLNVPFPMFQIVKPKMIAPLFRKSKTYRGFDIDLKNDIFINIDKYKAHLIKGSRKKSYSNLTKKEFNDEDLKCFIKDEDNDNILDYFQINGPNSSLATFLGGFKEYRDSDGDTIQDIYQTKSEYQYYGMLNFVDIDGDGLCDNYKPGIFNKEKLIASYKDITFDLSKDPFQNKQTAKDHMMGYSDVNNDNIIDCVQNPYCSSQLTGKKFVDKNYDTIDDNLQTIKAYDRFELTNFIDRDGDGLCDNYQ